MKFWSKTPLITCLGLSLWLAKAEAVYCDEIFRFDFESMAQREHFPKNERPARLDPFGKEDFAADYPDLEAVHKAVYEHFVPENARTDQVETLEPVLTIVIPAYKEASRLPTSIARIRNFFQKYPFPVEVQIRIEKSPDETAEVAQVAAEGAPYVHVYPHRVQRGKGYAVRQGVLNSKTDFVLFMDADLSTPLPEIFNFLLFAKNNPQYSVVIGDRHHPDSQIVQLQSTKRQVMGTVFRNMIQGVLSSFGLKGIYDTQAGFKMFTGEAGHDIFGRMTTDGFAFDIEALLYAKQLGYQISSRPIQWKDDARTTVNPIVDPLKMLNDTRKIYSKIKKEMKNQNQ